MRLHLLAAWMSLSWSQTGVADIDCTKAKVQAERIVCSSSSLRKLDRQLNRMYRAAIKAAASPTDLKRRQRMWLKGERDRCEDHYCLEKAYAERIAYVDLLLPAGEHEPFPESPVGEARDLTEQQAKQACADVAQALDRRSILRFAVEGVEYSWYDPDAFAPPLSEAEQQLLSASGSSYGNVVKVYGVTLQPGARLTRFARIQLQGTCIGWQILNLDRLLSTDFKEGGEELEDQEDEARWAYWGGGDDLIFLRGRYFRLSSGGPVGMVSWIRPNGNIRPICMLKSEPAPPSVIAANDKALCAAIVEGRLAPLSWKPADSGQRAALLEQLGSNVDTMETMQVDLDGEKQPDTIARLTYASAHGCGTHHEWLAHLPPDSESVEPGPLDEKLREISGVPLQVYRRKAEYYIEGNAGKNPGVFRVRGRAIEQVCRYQNNTRTTVERMIDLRGTPSTE
jgi:uncharacterized protein